MKEVLGIDERTWERLLNEVVEGNCVPLFSDKFARKSLFGEYDVVREWAIKHECPFESCDLAQVAQFIQFTEGPKPSKLDEIKSDYLDFVSKQLVQKARRDAVGQQPPFLQQMDREIRRRNIQVSDVAQRLELLDFDDEENPFRILAQLPVKMYLTTSYHQVMEMALRAADKKFESAICYWDNELVDEYPALSDKFKPDVDSLVYHLHGIETSRRTMVLTEDDHLDFLASSCRAIETHSSATGDGADSSSTRYADALRPWGWVKAALTRSALLLLDYDPLHWDFRVIVQGLLRGSENNRPRSIAVQLDAVGMDDEKRRQYLNYLEKYLAGDKIELQVFWGTAKDFIQTLDSKYRGLDGLSASQGT
jgi:hypothetical protein